MLIHSAAHYVTADRFMLVSPRLTSAYHKARRDLLWERSNEGSWPGELSSSALSTATAISALALASKRRVNSKNASSNESDQHSDQEHLDNSLIDRGIAWLVEQQNPDGGWGDTNLSYSNISTTMLVQAAIHLGGRAEYHDECLQRAKEYVDAAGGTDAVKKRYGKDKTFAVPILTNYALAGLCDWKIVSPLPFELACFPKKLYRMLNLRVVSYAIPALVAVGQARHHHLKPGNPITRWLRNRAQKRSLEIVQEMQPASGGFLEAIPLTSFVVMSLASIPNGPPQQERVIDDGLRFIRDSVRDDGSWPIDTNLATWNTSLAINALGVDGKWDSDTSLEWLLSCQNKTVHPFTGADPGGWGWSDLSGAVPDVDDTSAALLALAHFRRLPNLSSDDLSQIRFAAHLGLDWLVSLQNSDGGWPTFCRGWGKLPFDRSGTDLTAHALRAIDAWAELYDPRVVQSFIDSGMRYLERSQNADGSWTPLWFGNQDRLDESNPVYGTAKVLLAYRDLRRAEDSAAVAARQWIAGEQNDDGGWGTAGGRERDEYADEDEAAGANDRSGPSSVEETALAVEALLTTDEPLQFQSALSKGIDWLTTAVENDGHRTASPIGLYFAKLWYHEQLYPMTFIVSALGMAVHRLVTETGMVQAPKDASRR